MKSGVKYVLVSVVLMIIGLAIISTNGAGHKQVDTGQVFMGLLFFIPGLWMIILAFGKADS
jgi:hypothetical protein